MDRDAARGRDPEGQLKGLRPFNKTAAVPISPSDTTEG